MNISWQIAKHISLGNKNSFSRFIIRIAIAATSLSVAVMITAVCMANGFTQEIRDKVFGFWGHIQISHFQNNESFEEIPITENAKIIQSIQSVPEVEHISPYIHKAGIIKTKSAIEGIILKGVDQNYDWKFIQNYIQSGQTPIIQKDTISRELLISTNTAQRIGAKSGDALIIYFLPKNGGRPIGRKFKISGLFHTGLEEYDLRFAIGDLKILQQINQWDSLQYSGLEVKIKDISKVQEVSKQVYTALPTDLNAESIRDAQPNIFDWLELLVKNEIFTLILMIIVAILNMTTALMILILDRTRMIGILKALGARNIQIRKIFIYNALIILSLGIGIGNFVALGICWLQETFGIIQLNESAYYFKYMPVKIDYGYILAINLTTIVITLAVLIIPSMIISKVSPLKAIRYD